jgi:DNA-binding LytR/AlgR family response regulator
MVDFEDPKFHNNVDMLFLDIFMPGSNGIEVAREARQLGYTGTIIFLTVSEENYRDAFDVGAFHYITKGESVQRFEEIFLKAVDTTKQASQKEVVLSGWGEIKKLPVRSIVYFEVINKVITVCYDDQKFEFQGSLQSLENQLANSGFLRIHRNYLVSLTYVRSIAYEEVTLINGKKLPVGRKYYGKMKEAVQKMKL